MQQEVAVRIEKDNHPVPTLYGWFYGESK